MCWQGVSGMGMDLAGRSRVGLEREADALALVLVRYLRDGPEDAASARMRSRLRVLRRAAREAAGVTYPPPHAPAAPASRTDHKA